MADTLEQQAQAWQRIIKSDYHSNAEKAAARQKLVAYQKQRLAKTHTPDASSRAMVARMTPKEIAQLKTNLQTQYQWWNTGKGGRVSPRLEGYFESLRQKYPKGAPPIDPRAAAEFVFGFRGGRQKKLPEPSTRVIPSPGPHAPGGVDIADALRRLWENISQRKTMEPAAEKMFGSK